MSFLITVVRDTLLLPYKFVLFTHMLMEKITPQQTMFCRVITLLLFFLRITWINARMYGGNYIGYMYYIPILNRLDFPLIFQVLKRDTI